VGATKTAIVTGSSGFLGSRIAGLLVEDGYRVVGVDRGPESAAGVVPVSVSLPDPALDDILVAEQPTLIVHAAGPASVGHSVDDPRADFEGSVRVHVHLLDSVRRCAPDTRVIALSSAAVYGNPVALPVTEDAPLAPISPYGYHKVMCESLLHEYSSLYGIKTCALRVFSAYGAGLRRQLLWDVCTKAAHDQAVRLFGTGHETRDFVHADDVARAVRVLANRASFDGEPYNVASGQETSVREIAELIVGHVSPGKPIEFSGEQRGGDPLRWRADIARIGSLGFRPECSLQDGVTDYAAWYREVTRP